jgi:hypothetical protein
MFFCGEGGCFMLVCTLRGRLPPAAARVCAASAAGVRRGTGWACRGRPWSAKVQRLATPPALAATPCSGSPSAPLQAGEGPWKPPIDGRREGRGAGRRYRQAQLLQPIQLDQQRRQRVRQRGHVELAAAPQPSLCAQRHQPPAGELGGSAMDAQRACGCSRRRGAGLRHGPGEPGSPQPGPAR